MKKIRKKNYERMNELHRKIKYITNAEDLVVILSCHTKVTNI